MNSRSRASLLVLGSAAFMVSADARVINPLLDTISHQFSVPITQASIVMSAYTFPYGLFQLFYGPMGDRIGKLRVMSIALFLFAIGTAACGLVSSLWMFALLRFFTGVVAASVIPLSLAYIGDKFPLEGRQVALGRFMSSLMLGIVLSNTLGGVFGQYIGWRGIFILFGVVSLLISLLMYNESIAYPDEKKSDRRFGTATLLPYLNLLKIAPSRLVIIGVTLEGMLFFGGYEYMGAMILRTRFHLELVTTGLILAMYGIGGLCYSFLVKRMLKTMGALGLLVFGASLLCLGFIFITLIPIKMYLLLIPFITLMGMGFSSLHSTLQTRATEMAPGARGTAVSLFAFGLFFGQSIGVASLGQVIAHLGINVGFQVAGVGLLLLGLVLRQRFLVLDRRTVEAQA